MAAPTLVALAATFFENGDLGCTLVLENFQRDAGSFDEWRTHAGLGAGADHEDLVDFHSGTLLGVSKAIEEKNVLFRDGELAA